MDWLNLKEKIPQWISKYKYMILVVAIGLVLMSIPGRGESPGVITQNETTEVPGIQQQLEEILGQIQGVGRVKVLLTVSSGEKTLYETNEDRTDSVDSSMFREETILVTNGERAEQGLIRQVIPPVYQGAVVVCQGGDQPQIRLAVVEAVGDATGLTADKISVLKMK